MNKLLRLYVKLKCRLEGATAIEYAILVTLIAVAIIVAVTALGLALSGTFEGVTAELPS
jgi:pilus assembly protein Flp/PilA